MAKSAVNAISVYPIPRALPVNQDFDVFVRIPGGEWTEVGALLVKVDMHHVREASLVKFDYSGEVEVKVICNREPVKDVVIRPLSTGIHAEVIDERTIQFRLSRPQKLSVEINGDRFHNLHLFAKELEKLRPDSSDPGVACIHPGIHRIDVLQEKLADNRYHTLYFTAGLHHIEQVIVNVPSGKRIYIEGGAYVAGSFVCDKVENVQISGHGILYLAEFGRFSSFRGVRIMYSRNISVSGITVVDPPHYSIYLGQSQQIRISDFESFSTRGWSDGIDMMSCCDVEINHVFMRNSDDCIAIYGHRWGYYGDTRNINVKNSTLWADVAHPTNIGTHGDYEADGTLIENIIFENIDILEHHEPQDNYQGCLSINAGDKNTVRNVTYRNIRIEPFKLGRIIDIRVVWNPDYNPVPGNRIEQITFDGIYYNGSDDAISRISGFDDSRCVDGVTIHNLYINDRKVADVSSGNLELGEHVNNLTFS
ncbi:glycosyl hydrolase family 28 protein [Paenibacillus sp. JDR-2]|uniref:glycosyl hydrolase family 28 protein n=1 Tax=Paenibacillus sp. (strain JDR-2) TaxID=324057 RepID=UPI0001663EFE|nr:glycosyl hydrolase family 28 protein [Paenibacillus sp. JDR-2]ACT02764.1 Parallel beta-helix repeat protein [Paenibacillus sp. JDR-2]